MSSPDRVVLLHREDCTRNRRRERRSVEFRTASGVPDFGSSSAAPGRPFRSGAGFFYMIPKKRQSLGQQSHLAVVGATFIPSSLNLKVIPVYLELDLKNKTMKYRSESSDQSTISSSFRKGQSSTRRRRTAPSANNCGASATFCSRAKYLKPSPRRRSRTAALLAGTTCSGPSGSSVTLGTCPKASRLQDASYMKDG